MKCIITHYQRQEHEREVSTVQVEYEFNIEDGEQDEVKYSNDEEKEGNVITKSLKSQV